MFCKTFDWGLGELPEGDAKSSEMGIVNVWGKGSYMNEVM